MGFVIRGIVKTEGQVCGILRLSRYQAPKNMCDQYTIGAGCTADWFKKWSDSFQPIKKSRKGNQTNFEQFIILLQSRAQM